LEVLVSYLTSLLASVGHDGDHWWFVFPFFWFLWIALIATFLYFVVFRRRSGRCSSGTDRARAILAERFARGEITGEELRDRLAQLP
jgi:putative membrane protein